MHKFITNIRRFIRSRRMPKMWVLSYNSEWVVFDNKAEALAEYKRVIDRGAYCAVVCRMTSTRTDWF